MCVCWFITCVQINEAVDCFVWRIPFFARLSFWQQQYCDEALSVGGGKLSGNATCSGKGWLITAPNDPIPTWQGPTSDRPRPSAFSFGIDCRPGMHLHITDWVSIARKTQSLNYKQFLSQGKHRVLITNWVSIAWKTHSLNYKLSFYRMENTQS